MAKQKNKAKECAKTPNPLFPALARRPAPGNTKPTLTFSIPTLTETPKTRSAKPLIFAYYGFVEGYNNIFTNSVYSIPYTARGAAHIPHYIGSQQPYAQYAGANAGPDEGAGAPDEPEPGTGKYPPKAQSRERRRLYRL